MTPRGRLTDSTHSSSALRFMPIWTARELGPRQPHAYISKPNIVAHRHTYFLRVITRLKISPANGGNLVSGREQQRGRSLQAIQ